MADTLISILSMNRKAGAQECLESVLKHMPDCRIVLTDNGSVDGTGVYFDQLASNHPQITVFHERENTGFQHGHKRAFRMAAREGCRFFLCLNDDVVVTSETMLLLTAPFNNNPSLALCGDIHGCSSLDHNFHGHPGKLEYVEASSMVVNVPLVASLRNNLFPDTLKFAYGEDSELSLFIRERGYEITTVDAKVSHARSQTTNSSPELKEKCRQSQEHNHGVNRVRYEHYMRTRRMDYPIVVKRKMALGDVILTTPIIRAIRQSNPCSHIYVETDFPEVFSNNPHVTHASKRILPMPDQLLVDLDGSYEHMPNTHILEAYTAKAREAVKGMGEVDWFTELHPSESDKQWASKTCHGITTGKLALIHTDQSHWPGKNVRPELLEEVAHWLLGNGFAVACVGSMNKPPNIPGANLCGQTSILQLAALCQASQLFVGQDSAPMHIAQAAGCPTAPIFGVTSAKYITTRGGKCAPVESSRSIPSSGRRHRSSGMIFLKDGKDAMDSIMAQDVISAITRLEA